MMPAILRDRYEVLAVAAPGGEGGILRARDLTTGNDVALKRADDLAALAGLPPHPNLVTILDAFEDQGAGWLVTGWIDGENLTEVVDAVGPLGVARATRIAADAAGALSHMHGSGFVHGDVAPRNVILRPDGVAVLVDLGCAVRIGAPPRRAGTPGYAAPETALDGRAAIPADIFGFAATIYTMLTGEAPGPLGDPHGIPEALRRAIRRGLATTPDQRPTSVDALMDQLSPKTPPSNLALPSTTFVGRQIEVGRVVAQVTRDRFAVLTGPPGVGCSRLATEAARALASSYPDGTWTIARPRGSLEHAVARTVDPHALRVDRAWRVLVIIDGCDDDGILPEIETLLDDVPGIAVIVTSRIRWPRSNLTVEPLAVGEPDALDLVGLSRIEGVVLALDRLGLAAGDADHVRTAAELASKAEGLPLAIELLAAASGGAEGKRALAAAISDAFSSMTGEQRSTMAAIAHFEAPFTAGSARAVAPEATLSALRDLVRRSLLVEDLTTGRFSMLRVVRDAARSMRDATSPPPMAALAAWALDIVRAAEPKLYGPTQDEQLFSLDADLPTIRSVLEACAADAIDAPTDVEGGWPAIGLEIAARLYIYWGERLRAHEGLRYLEELLSIPGAGTATRRIALRGAAGLLTRVGSLQRARVMLEEILTIDRETGNIESMLATINELGIACAVGRDFDDAVAWFEEGLGIAETDGDPIRTLRMLSNLAHAYIAVARKEDAAAIISSGLARSGDDASTQLGFELARGFLLPGPEATGLFERVLQRAREVGLRATEVEASLLLGERLAIDGDPRAVELLEDALMAMGEQQDDLGVAVCFAALAAAYRTAGPARAAHLLGAASAIRERLGAPDVLTDRTPLGHPDREVARVAIDGARRALGDQAYERSYEAGVAARQEETFALALEALPERP